ncbi:hypothetical protein LTR78_010935 [Recurvomyces mirabilis]|uniref:Uncharacterized protein n=1 Tax=Recurvomyces mirabilis TaxID=574656 RepID=A0AAE0TR63_9PEZI|nr:hypothetical protein LTR78_010935 [Recurvomyces mirabilis]KAK5154994.1 hypothetical protein LTS14_005949 [Recurvomyces mirabilis]
MSKAQWLDYSRYMHAEHPRWRHAFIAKRWGALKIPLKKIAEWNRLNALGVFAPAAVLIAQVGGAAAAGQAMMGGNAVGGVGNAAAGGTGIAAGVVGVGPGGVGGAGQVAGRQGVTPGGGQVNVAGLALGVPRNATVGAGPVHVGHVPGAANHPVAAAQDASDNLHAQIDVEDPDPDMLYDWDCSDRVADDNTSRLEYLLQADHSNVFGTGWHAAKEACRGRNTTSIWFRLDDNDRISDRIVVKDTYLTLSQWVDVRKWEVENPKQRTMHPMEYGVQSILRKTSHDRHFAWIREGPDDPDLYREVSGGQDAHAWNGARGFRSLETTAVKPDLPWYLSQDEKILSASNIWSIGRTMISFNGPGFRL